VAAQARKEPDEEDAVQIYGSDGDPLCKFRLRSGAKEQETFHDKVVTIIGGGGVTASST
jgi:hypothetical protein